MREREIYCKCFGPFANTTIVIIEDYGESFRLSFDEGPEYDPSLLNGGKLAQLNHSAALRSIDLSSNGQLAATADESGSIKVWRTRDGSLLHTINHEAGRLRLQFLPDDRLLAYVECIRAGETSEMHGCVLAHVSRKAIQNRSECRFRENRRGFTVVDCIGH